jgi:DNA-binding CsgD family transcriptional regulator
VYPADELGTLYLTRRSAANGCPDCSLALEYSVIRPNIGGTLMVPDADLVSMIYEAAAIPERWPAVLSKLGSQVAAFGGAIVSMDPFKGARFIATESYSEAYATYAEASKRHHNVRPERAFARRHFGFLPDVALCTIEELENDPLYAEVLHPYGIGWTIGAPVTAPGEDLSFFDLCRLRKDVPFGDDEARLLDAYRPYLARAALMAARLGLDRARATAETLSLLGLPGGVISSTGRVLSVNRQLVDLYPQVIIGALDRLHLQDPRADALFGQALHQSDSDIGDRIGSIPMRGRAPHPALVIHLIPIQRGAHDIFSGGHFVLIATPVTTPAAPMSGMLSGLFDLTPAEARVASGIVSGITVRELAKNASVSRETIRSQLKVILAKTGTRRQIDLARLLSGTLGPH